MLNIYTVCRTEDLRSKFDQSTISVLTKCCWQSDLHYNPFLQYGCSFLLKSFLHLPKLKCQASYVWIATHSTEYPTSFVADKRHNNWIRINLVQIVFKRWQAYFPMLTCLIFLVTQLLCFKFVSVGWPCIDAILIFVYLVQGDLLKVKVNKLTSTKTQLPYSYYSLPYCRPEHIVDSAENLGEVLRGDRIENSAYVVS